MATISGNIQSSTSQASLDNKYGPYESIETANSALVVTRLGVQTDFRVSGLVIGITQNDGSVLEYICNNDGSNVTWDEKQPVSASEKAAWTGKQDAIDSLHKLSASLISGLATVATSGDYDNLSNKPTIPTVPTIAEGSTNGSISVGGTDVPVHGLGTAAYTASTAYIKGVMKNGSDITPDASQKVDIPNDVQTVSATTLAPGNPATAVYSGTNIEFGIPRGADAVNPFKGWFNSVSDLPQSPVDNPFVSGDYAYVYDSSASKHYLYKWNDSATPAAWEQALDSNNTPIEISANTAAFNSGELLASVKITDQITEDSSALATSGAVYGQVSQIALKVDTVAETLGFEYSEDDFDVYQVNAGQTTVVSDGNRIRVIKYLPSAAYLTAQSTLSPGIAIGLYSTLEKALIASTIVGESIEYISSYTTNKIEHQTAQGGYLSISFKNDTATSISADEKAAMLASLEVTVKAGIVPTVAELDAEVPQLASRVTNIEGNLSAINHYYKYISGGFLQSNGTITPNNDWVYTTDYIPASFNDVVNWRMGSDGGWSNLGYLVVYNSEKAVINYRSPYSHTPQRDFTLNLDVDTGVAYVRCSFYLRDIAECFLKINGVTVWAYSPVAHPTFAERITALERTDDDNEYDTLPLGEIAMVSNSTTEAETPYVAAVPYLGAEYELTIPSTLKIQFLHGPTYITNIASGWLANGDKFIIPSTSMFQKIQFCKADGSTIAVSDITDAIDDGDVVIQYKNREPRIEERNYDSEKYVKAAMLTYGTPDDKGYEYNRMATFVHVSDLHGDVKRFENAARYASLIGAKAIINTGDSVVFYGTDGSKFLRDVMDRYPSMPFINVIGNHEVNMADNSTDMADKYFNNAQIFSDFVEPYLEQGGYLQSDGVDATMPYYYVDFAIGIRVIVLNQFDAGVYGGEGLTGRVGQDQLEWLCATLKSTPENYGVIIAMHSNETEMTIPAAFDDWNQKYTYKGQSDDSYGYGREGLRDNNLRPIRSIVDAFIGRSSVSFNYDHATYYGNSGSVEINYDFSEGVATGVEFVCYLTGHRHMDNIGYVDGAESTQLILNICSSSCYYPLSSSLSFAEAEDLPRGDKGAVQDAFNVFSIDRVNGRVKVARVGSSVNFEGEERNFLMADYK